MSLLKLSESFGNLTRTQTLPDPNRAGQTFTSTYPCDVKGNKLAYGAKPLPLFRDDLSGEIFVRLVEKIPSASDSQSVAAAAAINALKPIHFVSPDGHISGYFVEAPDWNSREGK